MRAVFLSVLLLLAVACGGGNDAEPAADTSAQDTGSTPAGAASVSEDAASEPGDSAAPPAGGAGITLTIGDETWQFDSALCAYTNAPAGEDGSEWNVSFKQGDLQVYVNQDSYGPSISLTDVVNYGTLEWTAEGDAVTLTVDGNDITGSGTFTDKTGSGLEREGTLTASCANWVQG